MTAKLAGGDYYWNISSPIYTRVDGTPQPYLTGRKLHVEACNDKFAQDKYRDMELFIVCGDRTSLSPGYVIQETTTNDFPVMTMLQVPEMHEFLGFKTTKTGSITDGQNTIYSNVLFEYSINLIAGKDTFPAQTTSLNTPTKRAVIYKRAGIVEGMKLIDQTPGVGANDVWQITLVDYKDNICILNLEQADRT